MTETTTSSDPRATIREITKSTLCILCMVRDSAGFQGSALKDVEWAIQAQTDLLEMVK